MTSVPEFVIYGMAGLMLLLAGFLGWTLKGSLARRSYRKERTLFRDEQDTFQRKLKKLWDSELHGVLTEKETLQAKLLLLEQRVESYRQKLAGLGVLNFWGSKKRSDILYALLLENETLEQLLNAQTQRVAETHQQHLKEKLMDIHKRQRLLAEIFNDQKIKDYVRDVIAEKQDTLLSADAQLGRTETKTEETPKS